MKSIDKKNGFPPRIEVTEKLFPEVKKYLMNDQVKVTLIGRVKNISEAEDWGKMGAEPMKPGSKQPKPKKYIYVSVEAVQMDVEKLAGGKTEKEQAGEALAGKA